MKWREKSRKKGRLRAKMKPKSMKNPCVKKLVFLTCFESSLQDFRLENPGFWEPKSKTETIPKKMKKTIDFCNAFRNFFFNVRSSPKNANP